jgi:Ni/Fe-hydrogenase 1 B-type cytochrome subunit
MTTAGPTAAPQLATDEVAEPRERVYVWDLVVRSTHWLIALSLLLLSITGIYLGRPYLVVSGPAGEHFVMGTIRTIHNYGAIVFSLSVLARIVWMFTGPRHARWWNFVPVTRVRRKQFIGTVLFYTFLRPRPPAVVGHNPVAGASYVAVFGLYLTMIATGLGLYAASAHVDSPFAHFSFLLAVFGGAQMARFIHHVVMWLLIGFFVHHLYSAILMAVTEKNGVIDSIFSGNKWLLKHEAEQERAAQRRYDEVGGRE